MTARVISLGWFLPRNENSELVAKQYGRALHLPLLRGYADAWLFWAGETVVFEPKSDAAPDWRYEDWSTSPTLPVIRCLDLDSVKARLVKHGIELIEVDSDAYGNSFVMRDCDNHFVLFQQSDPSSELSSEKLARSRAAKPEIDRFNPGCAPMPSDIQGIDTIIRHVADLDAMTTFYTTVVGLDVVESTNGRTLLQCGEGTYIDLRPGGSAEPVPENRFERPDTFILRVNDFDGYRAKLIEAGASIVNDRIQFGRGALGYFCDPEGHLIGYEERYNQDRSDGTWTGFEEDLEANRRWQAGAA